MCKQALIKYTVELRAYSSLIIVINLTSVHAENNKVCEFVRLITTLHSLRSDIRRSTQTLNLDNTLEFWRTIVRCADSLNIYAFEVLLCAIRLQKSCYGYTNIDAAMVTLI